MGILFVPPLGVGDAHLGQHLAGRLAGRLAVQILVQLHRLPDLPADGLERVEAGHGVLEHHGDLPPADALPFGIGVQSGQVPAAIEDLPALDEAVLVVEAHEGLDQNALARAGFPDDGQALPPHHVQRDAPDGVEHLAAEGEFEMEIPDGKEDFALLSFHGDTSFTHGFWGRQRRQRRCPPHTD